MMNPRNPARTRPVSKADPAPTQVHDEEVYGTLGALMGMLEVIATDDQHPVGAVQSERLRVALSACDALQPQLESLLMLADAGLRTRLRRAHVTMRPLIEHAVRGALRSFQQSSISLVLPAEQGWGQQKVFIDSSRVDRMIKALAEQLARRVGDGGVIEVALAQRKGAVELGLRGKLGASRPGAGISELILRGAGHLLTLHGGGLRYDASAPSFIISLPASEAP